MGLVFKNDIATVEIDGQSYVIKQRFGDKIVHPESQMFLLYDIWHKISEYKNGRAVGASEFLGSVLTGMKSHRGQLDLFLTQSQPQQSEQQSDTYGPREFQGPMFDEMSERLRQMQGRETQPYEQSVVNDNSDSFTTAEQVNNGVENNNDVDSGEVYGPHMPAAKSSAANDNTISDDPSLWDEAWNTVTGWFSSETVENIPHPPMPPTNNNDGPYYTTSYSFDYADRVFTRGVNEESIFANLNTYFAQQGIEVSPEKMQQAREIYKQSIAQRGTSSWLSSTSQSPKPNLFNPNAFRLAWAGEGILSDVAASNAFRVNALRTALVEAGIAGGAVLAEMTVLAASGFVGYSIGDYVFGGLINSPLISDHSTSAYQRIHSNGEIYFGYDWSSFTFRGVFIGDITAQSFEGRPQELANILVKMGFTDGIIPLKYIGDDGRIEVDVSTGLLKDQTTDDDGSDTVLLAKRKAGDKQNSQQDPHISTTGGGMPDPDWDPDHDKDRPKDYDPDDPTSKDKWRLQQKDKVEEKKLKKMLCYVAGSEVQIIKDTVKWGSRALWYAKDISRHGGGAYKLFIKTKTEFQRVGVVDEFGKIMDRHQGTKGEFINLKKFCRGER